MSKVLLIICDALRDDIAGEQMGFLEGLVEDQKASRYTVIASLPALSRPLYETIHTGVPPSEHGITSNLMSRRSHMPNLFQLARDNNKTTAAAAYHWYSELYIHTPYDPVMDREVDDETQLIQHGRFYYRDEHDDAELFLSGMMLLQRHLPDYLLIHPMGADHIGHKYGGTSAEYKNQVALQDQIIANFAQMVAQIGYTILITGDHGMNENKTHNGIDVRYVPLYIITPEYTGLGYTGETVSQLQIAPTICKLLGIPPAETMKQLSIL